HNILPEITGSKLAQPKLGGSEVIDPSGQRRTTPGKLNLRAEIGADDVKLDFIQRPRAGCGAKESLSFRMLPAPCDPSREEQPLREGFEVRNGLAFWLNAAGGDR